jgi:hypothetical protein
MQVFWPDIGAAFYDLAKSLPAFAVPKGRQLISYSTVEESTIA